MGRQGEDLSKDLSINPVGLKFTFEIDLCPWVHIQGQEKRIIDYCVPEIHLY